MSRSSIALFLAGAGLATALAGCSGEPRQGEGGEDGRPSLQAPAQDGYGEAEGGEGGEGGEGDETGGGSERREGEGDDD